MIHEPFQKSESFNERVLTTTPFTLVRLYFLHCPHLHPTRLRSANSHGGRVPHYQHEQQWKSPLVLICHLPKLQLGLSFAPEICPVFLFFSFWFFFRQFFQFRRWTPQPPSSSGRAGREKYDYFDTEMISSYNSYQDFKILITIL